MMTISRLMFAHVNPAVSMKIIAVSQEMSYPLSHEIALLPNSFANVRSQFWNFVGIESIHKIV